MRARGKTNDPIDDIVAGLDATFYFFYILFSATSPLGARSCPGSRCRDSGRLGLFRGRQAGISRIII